jgi:hypothetical protein
MNETTRATIVPEKPTPDMPIGTYKVVDADGLYWGHYFIGINWANQRYVAEANPADGFPW